MNGLKGMMLGGAMGMALAGAALAPTAPAGFPDICRGGQNFWSYQ